MISRRRFLGVSSMAAAGVATTCQAPGGASSGDAAGARLPSIAALTSRAHEATPISVEERMGRIEKARRLMVDEGMDALMLTGGTSLNYFTNIQWVWSIFPLQFTRTM